MNQQHFYSEDRRWWWDGQSWRPTKVIGGLKGWQALLLALFVGTVTIFGQFLASGLDQIVRWLAG